MRYKWKMKVTDAQKDSIIRVREQDLKDAVCSDHQNCVIAKSIKRQTKAHWVDVGAKTVLIQLQPKGKVIRYKLNSLGQEQVKFFDKKGNFAPADVQLTSPAPSLRLEAGRDYSREYHLRKVAGDQNRSGPSHRRTKATR